MKYKLFPLAVAIGIISFVTIPQLPRLLSPAHAARECGEYTCIDFHSGEPQGRRETVPAGKEVVFVCEGAGAYSSYVVLINGKEEADIYGAPMSEPIPLSPGTYEVEFTSGEPGSEPLDSLILKVET